MRIVFLFIIFVIIGCGEQATNSELSDCYKDKVKLFENIDSLKNLVQETIVRDSINFIDSTVIKIKDSTVYNFRDSIVVSTRPSTEIKIVSIKTDSVYRNYKDKNFIPENMIDGILYLSKKNQGLRWPVPGYPHQAIFYFDTAYIVTEIWINSYGWDEGYTHLCKIWYFSDLIYSGKTAKELWSKHSIFYVGNHLYLEIISGENDWTDIAEIKIFGYKK